MLDTMHLHDIQEKILSVIGNGDILLIVPPFGSLHDVALGPHILQSLARQQGYATDILYLNLLLASYIGVKLYDDIYNAPVFWMAGERLFARSAYGFPSLGHHPEWCADEAMSIRGKKTHAKMFYDAHQHFDLQQYAAIEQICQELLDKVVPILSSLDYAIIGCTTSHTGQVNSSIALLTAIKTYRSDIITIIGGGSCQGEMAEGIASLSPAIDYIFSGESETSFLEFLKNYSEHQLPSHRVIIGETLHELDSLPYPDYDIFLKQSVSFLGKETCKKARLWYETSRGCWWAQHSRCTFCSETQAYRERNTATIIPDLKRIKTMYPQKMLFMTDILMPSSYHNTLLPELRKKTEFPALVYQLRPTLNLQELLNLRQAGVQAVLAGIETFSTHLLSLMNKGINSRQSLFFLRNARCVDIYVDWFLLWGFPGDCVSDYEEILRLLPFIRHLQPPRQLFPLTLERFCTYLDQQEEFQMTDVRPWTVFKLIYPNDVDLEKLACYYIAEFPSEAYEHPETIEQLNDEVDLWKKRWEQSKLMMKTMMDTYLIHDTREGQKIEKTHIVDYQRAKEIMTCRVYDESENVQWALEHKLGVVLEGWYVPLITASPHTLTTLQLFRE